MTVAPALTDSSHVNTGGAALILGCTRHRVLSFAARGLLTPIPLATHVFFARKQVEALAERLAAEGATTGHRPRGRRPRSPK